jgi:hypothetical protein
VTERQKDKGRRQNESRGSCRIKGARQRSAFSFAFSLLPSALNIPSMLDKPPTPLTTTERLAWIILILSLVVGFGMTGFAPT